MSQGQEPLRSVNTLALYARPTFNAVAEATARTRPGPPAVTTVATLVLHHELVSRPLWGNSAYRRLRVRSERVARLRATWLQSPGAQPVMSPYRTSPWRATSVGTTTTPARPASDSWSSTSPTDAALHLGLAGKLGRREVALSQLMRVNQLSRDQTRQLATGALRQWESTLDVTAEVRCS